MVQKTFGLALGELILKKRKILGLTQLQLAEDALGSGTKVRRISELENGVVANPHPKTIDPIISTLGISDQELESLLDEAQTKQTENDTLAIAYADASKLISDLANQFEFEHQDSSFENLDAFLRAKADEYIRLKEGIEKIAVLDATLDKIHTNAISQLNEGNFSEVDRLLIEAEDLQLSQKTQAELTKQFQIRTLRADSMFLKGDMDKACKLYVSAALFFEPFDQSLMIDSLHDLAGRIYEQQRRSLDASFLIPTNLLELALSKSNNPSLKLKTADAHFRLSLIYRNEASTPQNTKFEEAYLKKAIYHAREALKLTSANHDKYKIYSTQISLGNCLSQLTQLTQDPQHAKSAIDILDDLKSKIRQEKDHLDLLAHACNSLGAAILRLHRAESKQLDEADVALAVDAFEGALEASNHAFDLDVWGSANINLGRLLFTKSRQKQLEYYQAYFLTIRAISCFQAAIETYPENQFPDAFAEAHIGLADALSAHGDDYTRRNDLTFAEYYFGRAIDSYSRAMAYFTEEKFPDRWADIQTHLGSIFGNHAQFPDTPSKDDDLEKAMNFLKNGLRVFRKLKLRKKVEYCEKLIEELKKVEAGKGN